MNTACINDDKSATSSRLSRVPQYLGGGGEISCKITERQHIHFTIYIRAQSRLNKVGMMFLKSVRLEDVFHDRMQATS